VPELALKVGTTPTNDDGDILDAFSSRRIKAVHAQHACNAVVETDGSGLRIRGTLAELILQETRQYKFIRSGSVITRVNRLTSESEDVSDQIKIALFLERRLSNPNHRIFGTPGNEVWYGGRTAYDAVTLDRVWAEIEKRTELREADHRLWPFGRQDLKEHLIIPVDDFDDTTAEEAKTALMDTQDVQIVDVSIVRPAAKKTPGEFLITVDKTLDSIVWPDWIIADGESFRIGKGDGTTYGTKSQITPAVGPASISGRVKRRKHRVDWTADLGLDLEERALVLNKTITVDLRTVKSPYVRSGIVRTKTIE
jgi:hypothetical protein